MLSICFTEFIKGKPLWNCNNSFLTDIQYVNTVNKKIDEVKKQYNTVYQCITLRICTIYRIAKYNFHLMINFSCKENKSRQYLTSYRPICLLNTVYKIASASIANRFKTALDKLINKGQSGFISGRYIGDNTQL